MSKKEKMIIYYIGWVGVFISTVWMLDVIFRSKACNYEVIQNGQVIEKIYGKAYMFCRSFSNDGQYYKCIKGCTD